MPDLPLVSIITPSLNQAAYVQDSVSSIDSQDYPRIEHIIVDGGSTDGTLDILRRHEGPDRRVIVLEGSSQVEALNAAFAETKGEIIGWVNTDDAFFSVDAVGVAVERFESDPEAAVVYGDAVAADQEGRVLQHISVSDKRLARMQICSPFAQPAVFFRRSAVGESFLDDSFDLTMDYELWLRLARTGRFSKVDRILAVDRSYPECKSVSRWDDVPRELQRLADAYGVPFDTRPLPLRAFARWARRARGVIPLLRLEREYELAYAGRLDARWRRIFRQLVLPHRLLHTVGVGRDSA